MLLRDVGEGHVLSYVKTVFGASDLVVGIGDDAAVIRTSEALPVIASDAMVEGVHFTRKLFSAASVGRKLVAVNVSDFAAMGAFPVYATLTLALPPDLEVEWIETVLDSIASAAEQYGFSVIGGDVTGSPGPIMFSLSVCGQLSGVRAVERSGAVVGDTLYVTGALGGAALGWAVLEGRSDTHAPLAIRAFQEPLARLADGRRLGEWGACHAMMDLSDGLAVDAARMARASGLDFEIDLDRVPFHEELSGVSEAEAFVIHGGEDFELLFSCGEVPPVNATAIGRVVSGKGQVIWFRAGRHITLPEGKGFDHF